MAIAWDDIKKRYDELAQKLTDHALETAQRSIFQKELSHLSRLLEVHKATFEIEASLKEIADQLQSNKDSEMAQLYEQEQADLQEQLVKQQQTLDDILFPANPHDDRSVFLEIRAGAGGQEAALFATDLLRMYTNYSLVKGWKASVESANYTDLGGLREVILHIQGKDVYGLLKHESGVHRVQRVPETETQGRVHTSTATVAVLPEAQEVDVTINPADLRIDVFRAGGAGGQHVNTTDSAVRITHIPTGAVVSCQDERSQHKNKAKAMKILQSRILAAQMEVHHAEQSKKRKEMVGSGERSEKVRTYNFPQNRVTDHQVELTLKKLDMVIEGALDEIIQALADKERQDRKNNPVINK